MKNSPHEYADMLIDKYVSKLGTIGFANFKSIAIQCAILDVTNTIEVLRLELCGTDYYSALNYYDEVLTILKSKL